MLSQDSNPTSDKINIPSHTVSESFYRTTAALTDFVKDQVKPSLDGCLEMNQREIALASTFYRMYGWMLSLVAMNQNLHYQGIASATRSLFELMLDIELLHCDKDGRLVEQYFTFFRIEKYRVAKQIVAFGNRDNDNLINKVDIIHSFIEKVEKRSIDEEIYNVWGINKEKILKGNLKHWTNMSVRDRAKKIDDIYGNNRNMSFYIDTYPLLSWYIHAGGTGTLGLTEKAIDGIFRLCHYLSQTSFINGIKICAKEFKINLAIPAFEKLLDEASLVGARYIQEQEKLIISST